MDETLEEFGKFGKEFAESGLSGLASLSKSTQAIAAEAAQYASKSLEEGNAAVEQLVSAKSLEEVFAAQADYFKRTYEGFVAQTTTMGGLYADLARDVYKPFESVIAKAS